MALEKSEAVVLRGVDYSETSRIVTLLSPSRGRLTVIAKGARRKNSRLGSMLDRYNRVELVYSWKDGRAIQTLAEADLLDGFWDLKCDLERNIFAALPLELAGKIAHENEPSEELYETLVRGLSTLNAWRGDARRHVCWQVLHLLSVAGFAPALDVCSQCGSELPKALGWSLDGGVACRACSPGWQHRPDMRPLTRDALKLLLALRDSPSVCPEDGEGAALELEVFRVLSRYAMHQIEADLRSVRVLEEMFG